MGNGDEYKVTYQIGNDKPFLVEKLEKQLFIKKNYTIFVVWNLKI